MSVNVETPLLPDGRYVFEDFSFLISTCDEQSQKERVKHERRSVSEKVCGRGSGQSRTYEVVPSDYELDERVDDVGSLVDTLDILDDDAPLPHKLVLCLVLLRELVFRFGLGRGCRQDSWRGQACKSNRTIGATIAVAATYCTC